MERLCLLAPIWCGMLCSALLRLCEWRQRDLKGSSRSAPSPQSSCAQRGASVWCGLLLLGPTGLHLGARACCVRLRSVNPVAVCESLLWEVPFSLLTLCSNACELMYPCFLFFPIDRLFFCPFRLALFGWVRANLCFHSHACLFSLLCFWCPVSLLLPLGVSPCCAVRAFHVRLLIKAVVHEYFIFHDHEKINMEVRGRL